MSSSLDDIIASAGLPEYFNLGFDVVDALAVSAGNRLALVWAGASGESRALTYWELSTESNRVANVLRAKGIGARERVALVMPRTIRWWSIALGVLKRGGVLFPYIAVPGGEPLDVHCRRHGVSVIIADADHADAVDDMRPGMPGVEHYLLTGGARQQWDDFDSACGAQPRTLTAFGFDEMTTPDDPCLLINYPAADGRERTVLHAHSSMIANGRAARQWQGLSSNDIHLSLVPAPWTAWSWCALFAPWMCGGTLLVHEPAGVIDPETVLGVMAERGVTSLCTTPDLYRALVATPMKRYDLSTLRSAACAGAIDAQTLELWKDGTEGIGIHGGYGRPETPVILAVPATAAACADSYGLPVPPLEVAAVNGDGGEQPAGIAGNLALRMFPHAPAGVAADALDGAYPDLPSAGDWLSLGVRVVVDANGMVAPAAPMAREPGMLVHGIELPRP